MEKRELTCIGCPMGCALTVSLEAGKVVSVEGYTCKRGRDYGEKECTNPMRTGDQQRSGNRRRHCDGFRQDRLRHSQGKDSGMHGSHSHCHSPGPGSPRGCHPYKHSGYGRESDCDEGGRKKVGKITGFTLLLHEKNGQKVLSGGKEKERDRFSF